MYCILLYYTCGWLYTRLARMARDIPLYVSFLSYIARDLVTAETMVGPTQNSLNCGKGIK